MENKKDTILDSINKLNIKIKSFGDIEKQYLIGNTLENSVLCHEEDLRKILIIIIKNKGLYNIEGELSFNHAMMGTPIN